jgi:Family of unknown function (DUF6941)
MEATMLLCDWAEEINGKLYVMGGGWNRLTRRAPASTMALAVLVQVPWDRANMPHTLKASLMTEDGQPVTQEGKEVTVEGKMEVGRPPGIRPGTALAAPFALRFEGLLIEPGVYTWRLEVDGAELSRSSFEVVPGGSE